MFAPSLAVLLKARTTGGRWRSCGGGWWRGGGGWWSGGGGWWSGGGGWWSWAPHTHDEGCTHWTRLKSVNSQEVWLACSRCIPLVVAGGALVVGGGGPLVGGRGPLVGDRAGQHAMF